MDMAMAVMRSPAVTHSYVQTRWWMKIWISSLARLIPGHIRGPLPNPRKLYGLRAACSSPVHCVAVREGLQLYMAWQLSWRKSLI
jgi:hypothetical protein